MKYDIYIIIIISSSGESAHFTRKSRILFVAFEDNFYYLYLNIISKLSWLQRSILFLKCFELSTISILLMMTAITLLYPKCNSDKKPNNQWMTYLISHNAPSSQACFPFYPKMNQTFLYKYGRASDWAERSLDVCQLQATRKRGYWSRVHDWQRRCSSILLVVMPLERSAQIELMVARSLGLH